MRIKESYKKFGFFWLSTKPENKLPGLLSIKDGGCIDLEIFSYSQAQDNYVNNQFYHIIGTIEEDGAITLKNCHHFSHYYKNGIYGYIFSVKKAFVGYQYKENEQNTFKDFYFSVEGLHQWFPRSEMIKRENEQLEPITYQINNYKLSFHFLPKIHLEDNITCLKEQITRKVYCRIIAEKEQNLEELILISQKIIKFLCFSMDHIVCVDEVKLRSEKIKQELNGEKTPIYIKLYYKSQPFITVPPKIIWSLFKFESIENNMEQVINKWIEIYDKTHPALELYFSTQTGEHRFLEAKFLTLVQSVEAYQQRILCKKFNFKLLITKLIEPFEEWISNKETLIDQIKETRDYLTHYNPKKEDENLYKELYTVYQKLEVIFQMTILKTLNFDNQYIKNIILNNRRSKIKFKLLNNS